MSAPSPPLLEVRDLAVEFATPHGALRAVDGVSFSVTRGGALGIVGESGCGKSVTSLAVMRLLGESARVQSGEVWFEGRDLLRLEDAAMREVRGARLSMIFQEPMSALNPVFTAGFQIAESFRVHRGATKAEAWAQAIDMLRLVEMPEPERRARSYPHELSGGMRQRVMIAMALACRPSLLIADEPTTALDVTIEAQILDLLRDLRSRLGMSLVLITHDLGVVSAEADEVVIMYAGRIVERAPTARLFALPRHPYTRALLASVPRLGRRSGPLLSVPGSVPDPARLPTGCRFRDRCPRATSECATAEPELVEDGEGRRVACFHPEGPSW